MYLQFRKTRDHQAAYMFMKRLANVFYNRQGTCITLCIWKIKKDDFYTHTRHYTIKHLNNHIEQNHRHVKRRFVKSSRFQSILHASRTIKKSKLFMTYINKKEVCSNQTSFFRRTMNYRNYSELLKLQLYFVSWFMFFQTLQQNPCFSISLILVLICSSNCGDTFLGEPVSKGGCGLYSKIN